MRRQSVLPSLVAAVLVGLLAAGRSPAAAQEGTPAALPRTPDPAECRVEPRSLESMLALVGTPPADVSGQEAAPPVTPAPDLVGRGQPADAATVAGVTATVTELLACFNAGDVLRAFALFSDDLIRRELGPISAEEIPFIQASPVATAEEERTALLNVREVRVLEDGRVGAVVTVADPTDEGEGPAAAFLVFVRDGDRWRIDEFVELPVAGTPEAGTPQIGTPAA